MLGRIGGVFLLGLLVACSGAETKDDEQWGDSGGKEDIIVYEKDLKEQRAREREQMSQIGELAPAKREGNLNSEADVSEAMGSEDAVATEGATADTAGAGSVCSDNPGPAYNCTCVDAKVPSWVAKAKDQAWRVGDAIHAVVAVEGTKDLGMAADRALGRVSSKIAALRQGVKTDAHGFAGKPITSRLANLESLGVYVSPEGTVAAWGRLRTDDWRPDKNVIEANCPKPGLALYNCECAEGKRPSWVYRGAWWGGDGYVYATDTAPATGKRTEMRATNRARANLARFVQGFYLESQGMPPSGGAIKSIARLDLNLRKIQVVGQYKLPDGGMAVLVRMWVGK